MMKKENAIEISHVSKQYRLGVVSTGTLSHDINRWWNRMRGKENPYLKIGEENTQNIKTESEYVMALNDINFDVRQGEVLGIIGKNGAGKSTLLKILSKVTGPSTGEIKYRGRIGALLEVGTGFHLELTGRENIFLNGAILGMSKNEIRQKFDEIVEFSGCAKYVDTPVKRFSSGMLVRLGFAVAAFLEPEILIIDEVLAVGDAEFQKKAIGKMKDISSQNGRTVLFVSHNMAAIQSLCSRVVLIERGVIKEDGDVQEVVNKYLNQSIDKLSNFVRNNSSSGKIKINNIFLINEDLNKKVNNILSGSDIRICLEFESKTKIENLDVGLQIFDNNGVFITVLNNRMVNNNFDKIPSKGTIICQVPKIPLMYGKFYLTININVDNEQTELIENAFSFTITEGDYYKSGKPNSGMRQGVYIDQKWKIQ